MDSALTEGYKYITRDDYHCLLCGGDNVTSKLVTSCIKCGRRWENLPGSTLRGRYGIPYMVCDSCGNDRTVLARVHCCMDCGAKEKGYDKED